MTEYTTRIRNAYSSVCATHSIHLPEKKRKKRKKKKILCCTLQIWPKNVDAIRRAKTDLTSFNCVSPLSLSGNATCLFFTHSEPEKRNSCDLGERQSLLLFVSFCRELWIEGGIYNYSSELNIKSVTIHTDANMHNNMRLHNYYMCVRIFKHVSRYKHIKVGGGRGV